MKKLPVDERKVSVTIALPQETLKRIDSLSDSLNCSRSWIITEAIRAFKEYGELIKEVEQIAEQTDKV